MNLRLFAILALSITACSKGGSISSSSSSGITGEVTLSKVFPSGDGASWTAITSSGRYYIHGLDLTITGLCSRGIATIKVDEGGAPYSETATCLEDGTFTFNKSYIASTEEGDKSLTLTAYDILGTAVSGSTLAASVRIDGTVPASPVLSAPLNVSGAYNYTGANSSYTINGTAAADVVKIIGPGSVVITPSGGTWSHTVTLVEGQTDTFNFYAYDLAGNVAPVTSKDLSWNPDLQLHQASVFPGDVPTDGGTSFSMEATVSEPTGTVTDGGTSFGLLSAFNYIINKLRGL